MHHFNPFRTPTAGAPGIGIDSNDGNVAFDAEEIRLLGSGIVRWPEFVKLSESEQETLKLVQKTSLEVREGIGRPALGKSCEKCGRLIG